MARAGRWPDSWLMECGEWFRQACGSLLDLVLPAQCAGCGATGSPWCPGCAHELAMCCFPQPRHAPPTPCPAGMPPVVAAGRYAGVLRAALVAVKDDGRTDLRVHLAPLLRSAVEVAGTAYPDAVLVPMPSSRSAVRRRGEASVAELTRRADRLAHRPRGVVPALRPLRQVADQARLGRLARAANLTGAYAVPARFVRTLQGKPVLLVDDVVTTGATLTEGARALRAAGAHVVGAAVVAATERRRDSRRGSSANTGPPG